MQRVFALQNDGSTDGGKVHVPTNDGLLQRKAAERAPDGNTGRRAEGQGGEVRQGKAGLFFLGYPAGTEKRIADMIAGWLIAYGAVLLLSFGWSWYELVHAPTDKDLWGEEIE